MSAGYTRALATTMAAEVRKAFPGIRTSKAGITWSGKQAFFQFIEPGFPRLEIWLRAADAYDARARGWAKYLLLLKPPE